MSPFFLVAPRWPLGIASDVSENAQPFVDPKSFKWRDKEMRIRDSLHSIAFLDSLWQRGTTTFSTSSLGYAHIGSEQAVPLLMDLGPFPAVYILRSTHEITS